MNPLETEADEMSPEYDFSRGTRGQFAERYQNGTNVVVLAPDVSAAFPDAESVNNALRALIQVAQRSVPSQK